jgi:hypothetical protein
VYNRVTVPMADGRLVPSDRYLLDRTLSPSPFKPQSRTNNTYHLKIKKSISRRLHSTTIPHIRSPTSSIIVSKAHAFSWPSPASTTSKIFFSLPKIRSFPQSSIQPTKECLDVLNSGKRKGPTRNRTGVARTVQTRSWKSEGSEPEVITATL